MHGSEAEGGLWKYRARVAAQGALTPEQERSLAHAWRAGDVQAGSRLIASNLRHVIGIAQQYRRWGVPLDDLVQQGNIGLLKAIAHYDPSHQSTLRSYASYWIKAEIRDYVMRCYRIVRLGTTRTERRALRAYRTQSIEHAEDLARVSGMPEARCQMLWPLLAQHDRSLDAVLPSGTRGGDLLPSADPDPERIALKSEATRHDRDRVEQALACLTERERHIVWARMAQDEPETLAQIGACLGVSRERVRQLEARATQKMRVALGAASAAA